MSSSDESDENELTPPEIQAEAKLIVENLLPSKSKEKYLKTYADFNKWKIDRKSKSLSENVFLAYFNQLIVSNKYKPTTLWAVYSMLKSTVLVKHNLNISTYRKLTTMLKRQGEGYKCKKSKVLSRENIENFLSNAPDSEYLATKVIAMGATRCCYRGCENTSEHHSLFRFPVRHKYRLKIWLENAGNMALKSLSNDELRRRYLCDAHFKKNMIRPHTKLRKLLCNHALPVPYFPECAIESDSPKLELNLKPLQLEAKSALLEEVMSDPLELFLEVKSKPLESEEKSEPFEEVMSDPLGLFLEVKSKPVESEEKSFKELMADPLGLFLEIKSKPVKLEENSKPLEKVNSERLESLLEVKSEPLEEPMSDSHELNSELLQLEKRSDSLEEVMSVSLELKSEPLELEEKSEPFEKVISKSVELEENSEPPKELKSEPLELAENWESLELVVKKPTKVYKKRSCNVSIKIFPKLVEKDVNIASSSASLGPPWAGHRPPPSRTPTGSRTKRVVFSQLPYTEQIDKLKKAISNSVRMLKESRRQVKCLKKRTENRKKLIDIEKFKFKSDASKILTKMQLRKKKKRYWTEEQKNFCMSLYIKSPTGYYWLRKSGVVLASRSTVKRWLADKNNFKQTL